MLVYTYKNITVNVNTIRPEWVEQMGETILTLDSSFIVELLENECTFSEFFLMYECDCHEEFDNTEIDEAIKYFSNLDERVEVRNADAIIGVYEYALEQDKSFEFDVDTENISWVIHDLLHATYDAAGCTIYVESDIEKERILESLKITKENFLEDLPNYDFLEKLETEFYARFDKHIDLEEFKYIEEYNY